MMMMRGTKKKKNNVASIFATAAASEELLSFYFTDSNGCFQCVFFRHTVPHGAFFVRVSFHRLLFLVVSVLFVLR